MIRVLVIALSISALLATPLVERKKKVIGGVPAYRGEFPHQVLILRYGYVYFGGSIISTKHVLTAAHCDMATLRNFEVLAGLVSLQDSGSAQRRLLSLYRRSCKWRAVSMLQLQKCRSLSHSTTTLKRLASTAIDHIHFIV